jgi:S-adenosylmethionine:tRNA ribosyltransferase-isomerase
MPFTKLVKFPEGVPAGEPSEARGLRRDRVRLLVLDRLSGEIHHARFDQLGRFLRRGDIVVLNDSRTLPVALEARLPDGQKTPVRLARDGGGAWTCVTPRRIELRAGDLLWLAQGQLPARILGRRGRLRWRVEPLHTDTQLLELLYQTGQPVWYSHVRRAWDLDYFQTVYAAHPGSAEMPSAGRPFSWELLFRLRAQGIALASITLHTALGPQDDEPRYKAASEEFFVSPRTAQQINEARERGGRVIAVGTTVIRTLETVASSSGEIRPDHGWTRLHIKPGYRFRVIDGLISGFHERDSNHLDLITAFVARSFLHRAYQAAARAGYRWHEFGDANLIL